MLDDTRSGAPAGDDTTYAGQSLGEATPAIGDGLHAALDAAVAALDDVEGLSTLQRLKLTRELAAIREALGSNPGTLARLKLAKRLAEVREALGAARPAKREDPPPVDTEGQADDIAEGRAERQSTHQFYDFDPNRKQGQRKRDNAEAMALLRDIDAGRLDPKSLTDAQRQALAKYSGTGGALVGADGKKGSAYEYYTPKPIAEGMWSLLRELGFQGGRVLDPSAGVGIFGATAPGNAAVDAVELNETSGRVNGLVNDGPGYKAVVAPFEQVAAATPDEMYDVVVTNVPFGGVEDRGGNQYKDTKYRGEPLQNYFILRSLEKLRPGGLAAFITPPRCVSGKGGKEEDLRQRTSYMAEFMGAYRLPNSVFGTAAADTITDVIVFRKFSREALDKIEELREQNPTALVAANVVWPEFIEGNYFKGEGRRFILGEFVAKDPTKYRDVDRVVNNGSIGDIAKLLRRFGDSRIDWSALDAAETSPIVYREGDTLRHAGQTLQMKGGRWVVLQSAAADDAAAELAESVARITTPLGAVNSNTDYEQAVRVQDAMVESGQALMVPDWMRGLLSALLKLPAGERPAAWGAAIVGLGIDQAMMERQGETTGFNYLEGYPVLSDAMKRVVSDASRPAAALPTAVKTAMRKVGVYFGKRDGFTAVWRGDVAQDVDGRDDAQRFEAARYQAGGGAFVPLDQARQVYGADFDPMDGDDWCVSADGQSVSKADDYYVGNYADFLARIKADIEAATSDAVRDKLMRQKIAAEKRLSRQDPSIMSFSLFSPFVTIEERAEFVRRFVDKRFSVAYDEKTGKPYIECDINSPANEAERNLKRFAEFLKTGTLATRSGAAGRDDPKLEEKRVAALRELTQRSGAQFNSWVKSNTIIMGRLADVANDPQRLYFNQVEDESPLTIPGLNPEWEVRPFQAAYVRKTGRDFSGINGFGVGLGKTSTALIAVQHAQSIGVKKKTFFVVPNSVLSNWRKEAGRVLASTDDCLFVGLTIDKNGKAKVDTKNYDRDLNRILENRHRKIFISMEAFQRLRLKQDTAVAYDAYLASVDASYAASDDKKTDEKSKSKRAALIEQLTSDGAKSMAAPFFEDLGVDSIVIDEAHMMKNSRETVDFSGGKFLSLAQASARGLDAQAKAWYVRKDSPRKDGVILLSATPVTNSPLEVYSMLALAVGDAKLNDLMMGVRGADDFMEVMCRMESQDEQTLDGLVKPYEVFTGLTNANVLRNALAATCTIKTAQDVGAQIVMPDSDEKPTPVALPDDVKATLLEYKDAFRYALDTLMEKNNPGGSKDAYDRVAEKFGEPMELIAHPFNLINKMTSLIADPELDQRATFFNISPAQEAKAAEVVGKWNAKAPTEERARPGPHTEAGAVVGVKKVKDGDDFIELLKVQARAKLVGERIVIDTIQPDTQASFEAMAESAGLDLDVNVPPKLAALLENFQFEEANPRGQVEGLPSGRVRQLIFCDVLAMHGKIKRLLAKRCGVASGSIAIITGKINGKPEQILEVQDGFNAEGDDNKYRAIIANEKAEVGINLQKGTQAIHHLTLGWTPDSLTQRNGRGARQGNETKRVTIYQYDADGTFDSYKRMLVGKKASWIDTLMDKEGGDTVDVSGGMTRQQMESLIDSVGDSNAMGRIQAKADAAERLARVNSTQGKQAVNLQTIKAQQDFLGKYSKVQSWAADKLAAYIVARNQALAITARLSDPKATASAVVRNQNLLAEITARRDGLRRMLDESVKLFKEKDSYTPEAAISLDEFITKALRYAKKNDKPHEVVATQFREGGGYGYRVEVSEDGAIGNEWQSEVDMATGMMDESRKDFIRLAGQDGGHSAKVLDRAESDEAAVIDGKVICAGAFIQKGDELGVVSKERLGFIATFVGAEGRARRIAAADAARGATVALPGAPGYDAMLTMAAQIEDDLAEKGAMPVDGMGALFSATIPEVAQRRSKLMVIRYPASQYSLPAPYFPIVVASDQAEDARVLSMIAAQQKAIVKAATSDGYNVFFECDSSVAVERQESEPSPWEVLIEFAKARGVKVTSADFKVFNTRRYQAATSVMLNGGARATFGESVIAGATSKPQLEQRLKAWLETEAFQFYDLASDAELSKVEPAALLRAAASSLSYDYMRAITSIERAEAAAAAAAAGGDQPAEVTPLKAPEGVKAGSYVPADVEEFVGITGDTKPWKEQIKGMASQAGAGGFKWQGEKVTSTPHWRVKYKVFLALIGAYPAAARVLHTIRA